MSDRENNVYKAKLAQKAERYDDMWEAMKKVASLDVELTVEEKDLFSVACKNVIGVRKASWNIISSAEKIKKRDGSEKLELIQTYRAQVENELKEISSDILKLVDKHNLIPCATSGESKVFFFMMKGDYHRYLAEFATGGDRKGAAENSLVAYKAARDIAMEELTPAHHIRLNLALSFAKFYADVLSDEDEALRLLKAAYSDAEREVDMLPENSPYFMNVCNAITFMMCENPKMSDFISCQTLGITSNNN